MHCILAAYKKFAIECFDDVLICSPSLAEHTLHVDTILLAIGAAHLRLNERKCVVGPTEMLFVGFKVNSSGIHMEDMKIAAINDWPVPGSTAQLWAFLGLAGYYKIFVNKFAHWTTQLYAWTAGKLALWWLWKHQAALNDTPSALASAQALAHHDPEREFTLHTNASELAMRGVLAQMQRRGLMGQLLKCPLGFFSREAHAVETCCAAYDRKWLVIHNYFIHCQPYLNS